MIINEEYLKKYNMETLEQVKELFGDTVETEINYYKTFLTQSDYMITKMVESYIMGVSIDKLQYKYSDLINTRQQCRDKINELQSLINE